MLWKFRTTQHFASPSVTYQVVCSTNRNSSGDIILCLKRSKYDFCSLTVSYFLKKNRAFSHITWWYVQILRVTKVTRAVPVNDYYHVKRIALNSVFVRLRFFITIVLPLLRLNQIIWGVDRGCNYYYYAANSQWPNRRTDRRDATRYFLFLNH